MTTIGTKIFIKLFCLSVGQDQFGNSYYQTKKKGSTGKYKRLVIYNGIEDASKIPALWHAWLHYTVDDIPLNQIKYNWEKTHVPNLTGTDYAYFPDGYKEISNGEIKRNANGNYQAWKPSN